MSRLVLVLLLVVSFCASVARGHGVNDPGDASARPEPVPVLAQGGAPLGDRAGHGVEAPLLAAPRPPIVTGELATARFRILHTERTKGAAEGLSEWLETERDNFTRHFGRDWPGTIEVRLGAGRTELEALALPGGRPPSWAIALAYPSHGIILLDALQLASSEGLTTLRHELAHVALGRLGRGWPRWFQEGMAQHLTGERLSLNHYTSLFQAVRSERVLSFESLTSGWPEHAADVQLAYAQSAAFVAWLSDRYGAGGLGALLDRVGAGEDFSLAFAKAFDTSLRMEEDAWRQTLPSRYGWMPWVTTGSLVLSLAALACVLGYVRRRRQLALRLEEMAAEEAAEDAARRLLEAELVALEAEIKGAPPHDSGDAPFGPYREPGEGKEARFGREDRDALVEGLRRAAEGRVEEHVADADVDGAAEGDSDAHAAQEDPHEAEEEVDYGLPRRGKDILH